MAKEVLFVRTDRIGDFLLNLPAIHAIKKTYPNANITVVLHPLVEQLVHKHPDIHKTIPFDTTTKPSLASWIHLYKNLKTTNYDVAIISNPHKYFHLLCTLLRIPKRIGYRRKWPFFLTDTITDKKDQSNKHEVEYNIDLVSLMGNVHPDIKFPSPKPYTLPIEIKEEEQLKLRLQDIGVPVDMPFIVVHPHTTNIKKQWPLTKMLSLIQKISDMPSYTLLIVGGPVERKISQEALMKHLNDKPVFDLTGHLNLRELAALLKISKLIISNDSGPVHIAAAYETKMIVLFGNTTTGSNPKRWGPWRKSGIDTIRKSDIKDITVEEVWKATQNLLK